MVKMPAVDTEKMLALFSLRKRGLDLAGFSKLPVPVYRDIVQCSCGSTPVGSQGVRVLCDLEERIETTTSGAAVLVNVLAKDAREFLAKPS